MNMQQARPVENDRETGRDDRVPEIATENEALHSALENLRLEGAIFFRAEYTEDWAYESPTARELAGILTPGHDRLILFHIVARGSCTILLDDGQEQRAETGDVIVLPYGDQHIMHGRCRAEWVPPIATLMDNPPWETLPIVRHGGGGDRTDVICGYLVSDDPLFDERLAALPSVFVVQPAGAASKWVEASIEYAVDGPSIETTPRLAELLLIEVLHMHLATAPAADQGWLAALRDPVLAPALAVLHRHPERRWTVADLADVAAASRSTLDQRFRDLLGRPPMRYLTDWRMHVAKDLLAHTSLTVGAVADRVGYDAVEAFSRAFRRFHGLSPADWRAERV